MKLRSTSVVKPIVQRSEKRIVENDRSMIQTKRRSFNDCLKTDRSTIVQQSRKRIVENDRLSILKNDRWIPFVNDHSTIAKKDR